MQGILDRLVAPLPSRSAIVYVAERWRRILLQCSGVHLEFVAALEKTAPGNISPNWPIAGAASSLSATSRTCLSHFRHPAAVSNSSNCDGSQNIRDVTAVSIQTRENNFGIILFPHAERRMIGSSNLRLLIGLALQIGLTLENYAIMHDAQRRTKEYELLTQIGQAISSHLDQDEILRTIQVELGQIFYTRGLLHSLPGRGGNPLRARSGKRPDSSETLAPIEQRIERIHHPHRPTVVDSLTASRRPERSWPCRSRRLGPAKSFCAAPILLGGKAAGVMAAMSHEREYVFEPRDLEVMKTAAGQVSVAVENARLFAEEQRRSHHLSFLNNVSKTAISSDDAEQMLEAIVQEIAKNFHFDHIGVGILDYATKDIEIKAEAGTNSAARGQRFSLGTATRSGRPLWHDPASHDANGNLGGVLPQARSILCIPIAMAKRSSESSISKASRKSLLCRQRSHT